MILHGFSWIEIHIIKTSNGWMNGKTLNFNRIVKKKKDCAPDISGAGTQKNKGSRRSSGFVVSKGSSSKRDGQHQRGLKH